MSIQVTIDGHVAFDASSQSDKILVPFDEAERAAVFAALTGALAHLCGIKPLYRSDATAVGKDEHCAETEQCQSDHTGGVVVHLAARQAERGGGSKP